MKASASDVTSKILRGRKQWLATGALVLVALCFLCIVLWTDELPGPRNEDASVARISSKSAQEQGATPALPTLVEREVVAGLGILVVHVKYADGKPASRVRVGVRRDVPLAPVQRWDMADFHGCARFEGLAPGTVCVETDRRIASKDCLVDIRCGEESHLDLTIKHCGEIVGRVLDVTGQPIAGARIVLAAMMVEGHVPSEVCRTDQDGRFEFRTGLQPSLVGAQADGHSPSAFVMVSFDGRLGEQQRVDFVLEDGLLVAGVIHDESGAPVDDCLVEIGHQSIGAPLAPVIAPSVPVSLRTGRDGRFSTREAKLGRVYVTASKAGFATAIDCIDVGTSQAECMAIMLSAEARLRGTVCDAAGKALAGVRIRAAVKDGRWRHLTATDGAGEYVISGAPLGELQVAAHYESEQSEERQVYLARGGDVVCDFVRAAGRLITGRVVDEDGVPLPGAVVRIKLDASWRQSGIAACDNEGRFAFKDMGGHSAELTAERDGFYTTTVPNIVGHRELKDVVLAPLPKRYAIVRAHVVEADGAPAAYATVKLDGPHDTSASANCDGDGWLTVGPVLAGECRLRVVHVGSPVRQEKLELFSGANEIGTIRLHSGGVIRVECSRPAD